MKKYLMIKEIIEYLVGFPTELLISIILKMRIIYILFITIRMND